MPGGEDAQANFPFRDPDLPLGERARDLVSRLSLEEKLGMMASRQAAVPRLGLGEFAIGGEAAHGFVSADGPATCFPQTIGLSCSWDPELLRRIGSTAGDEARAYYKRRNRSGGLCLFAPTVDMARDPRWGRTEESYGEDPVLAGRLSEAFVRGLQGDHPFYLKAAATPKHFYANNNEERRTSSSSSVTPRARREYYLAAFEPASRRAKAASIMTSYNAINGVPAMLHPDLLGVVKGEWGMDGFAVCDGGALPLLASDHGACGDIEEAAALALRAGIDNFTEDPALVRKALRGALERRLIVEADIDRALERVFKVRIRLGQFDPPGRDPYEAIDETVLWGAEPKRLALQAARESIVLLANVGAGTGAGPLLPLDPAGIESLAALGPLADGRYRDWYSGKGAYHVSPLQALCERLPGVKIRHADGSDIVSFRAADGRGIGAESWISSRLAANRPPAEPGEMFRRSDWGWGNQTFKSLSSGRYLSADEQSLRASAEEVWGWFVRERFSLEETRTEDGRAAYSMRTWKGDPVGIGEDGGLDVISSRPGEAGAPLIVEKIRDGIAEAASIASGSDAALLFLGNHPLLVAKEEHDRPSLRLPPDQERLAEAVISANPRTVVVIVGSYPYALGPWRERAAAILYAPHGGQEAGNALADVILGACPPSGRLTMTWYGDEGAPGAITDYDIARKGATYRHYRGLPLYPFGHGLGYSPIEYSLLRLSSESIAPGGELRAEFELKNPGTKDAIEVVQLYVSLPGSALRRPIKKLADFARVAVPAGGTVEAELVLRAHDLEAWDQGSGAWLLERGGCLLEIGASSADPRLAGGIRVEGSAPPRRDPYRWTDADAFDDMEGLILDAGESGASCLRRTAPEGAETAFLVFDRMDFGEGGDGRFEAIVSGSREGKLGLSFAPSGGKDISIEGPGISAWTEVSGSLPLPRGSSSASLAISGDLRLLRFRFTPA